MNISSEDLERFTPLSKIVGSPPSQGGLPSFPGRVARGNW
jgi:hypothetical protein